MKYIIFFSVLLVSIPAGYFLSLSKKLLKIPVMLIFLFVLFFQQTSINFFSYRLYRGTSRGMEVSICYICAFMLLGAIFFRRGRIRLMPDGGSWLYLLYFLSCIVSMVNADNYLFSFFELWKMAMMYGVYLAIWNYLDYTHDFTTVLYSLGVTVVLGFFPVVTQHYSGIMQVYGIFPHQNSAAVFMVLCTPLFFSRFFNSTDMKKDIFIIPSLFCGSISLILTYSRGGMFCLPLAISVTILVSLIFQFSATKLIYCFVFIAAAILIGALFVPRIVQRFETAPKESANTRIILAGSAWNMMKDKFLGVGINNWGIKINHPYNYKPKGSKDWGYGDKNFKRPLVETVYLLVGAECGFLGLLYFICWLWYYLIVGVLMLKPLRNTSYFYLPAGIVGGLVGIYLQSALEWVLKQQINYLELMIFFAIIGFLHVKIKENKKQRSTSVV